MTPEEAMRLFRMHKDIDETSKEIYLNPQFTKTCKDCGKDISKIDYKLDKYFLEGDGWNQKRFCDNCRHKHSLEQQRRIKKIRDEYKDGFTPEEEELLLILEIEKLRNKINEYEEKLWKLKNDYCD